MSVMSVVLSGRGLCDGPITRPEEYYREYVCLCVSGCDRETSTMVRPGPLWVRLRETYETWYIYLSEGHKRLKQYLHEVFRYVRHTVIKIKINCVPSFLSPSNSLTHVNIIAILL